MFGIEEEEELVPFLPRVPVVDQCLNGEFELRINNINGVGINGTAEWWRFLDLRIGPTSEYWELMLIVHHHEFINKKTFSGLLILVCDIILTHTYIYCT